MKRNINSFPFLGVVTRRHRALATLKQNKTHSTKSLPDRITLQTTSRTCFGRFHGYCSVTLDNHIMLVFDGLLDKRERDKTWKDVIGKSRSLLYHHSSFRFLLIDSQNAGTIHHISLKQGDFTNIPEFFAMALWITIQGASSRVCIHMEYFLHNKQIIKS